jgi:hypothetical protein
VCNAEKFVGDIVEVCKNVIVSPYKNYLFADICGNL